MRPREPIVDDPEQVVVRDKRRLDPDSGAVREGGSTWGRAGGSTPPPPGAPAPPGEGVGGVTAAPAGAQAEGTAVSTADELNAEEDQMAAELTADLQRVSAEYANYRKRVDRDRVAVVEMATAGLLSGLLPVLDDLDRAREHGDLTGAFKGVGDSLVALTAKLGLERYGEVGDAFDPTVHEALMQAEPDPGQSVPTCAAVLQPGYRLSGGRVLRPARVSVAEGTGTESADAAG